MSNAQIDNVAETAQLERSINEIQRRRQRSAPNIDFAQHKLEDGTIISTRERVVTEVPAPAKNIPTDEQFFSKTKEGMPDIDYLKEHFRREGRISEVHAVYILEKAAEILRAEPNLLSVGVPVTVCGDIQGQYVCLGQQPSSLPCPLIMRYLFLGGYINNGYFSIGCVLYLWSLKIWYPDNFFLLRSNLESRHLSDDIAFKLECKHKYSERLYEACLNSFCALPLAAIMDKQFFCVHGGISPELDTLDDIRNMNRFREPPASGLMCDILWSDPMADFGEEKGPESFVHNHVRKCSYFFSYQAACAFLERNRLLSIIRAYEVHDAGYCLYRNRRKNDFPSVITVFSAPNYVDEHRNQAAILKYESNKLIIQRFHPVSHPYRLPDFQHAFTWSLPFVGKKFAEIVLALMFDREITMAISTG